MEGKTQYLDFNLSINTISESDAVPLSAFSCGCDEIDDFFHNEVFLCYKYGYLIPYKCTAKDSGEILGLFTLANDVLTLEFEDKVDFPNLTFEYSDIFRHQPTYPAINIGHLAVRKDMQSKGIGRIIVDFIHMTFATRRISGCQFITVDALNNPRTLSFYSDKLGFEFQTLSDMGKHTRRMYLDIFSHPD